MFAGALLWTLLILGAPSLRFLILLPRARPALEATGLVVVTLASVLAYIRYSLTGSRSFLLIAVAFVVLGANQLVFGLIVPPDLLGAEPAVYFWSAGRLLVGILLLAGAMGSPESDGSSRRPLARFLLGVAAATVLLGAIEALMWVFRERLPPMSVLPQPLHPDQVTSALPGLTVAAVVLGAVGTGLFLAAALAYLRSSTRHPTLSMLAPVLVLAAFSHIHYMLVPTVFTRWVSTGDLLRLAFSAALLVVLVWDMRGTYLAERSESLALAEAYAAERGRVQELEELERAKAELFGIVSHELVHPAAALRAMVLMLSRRGHQLDEEVHQELLDRMGRESLRLRDLAEEVTTASQGQAGRLSVRPRSQRVDQLIREVVESCADYQSRINVRVDPSVGQAMVQADPGRILQVFRNLLSNASKYADESGPVEIRVELDGDDVSFAVEDRGPGIPPEDLPRLFKPFSRVGTVDGQLRPGAGLGLYISRQIVEAHGGRINVDSRVGHGSSFRFTLPRALTLRRPVHG